MVEYRLELQCTHTKNDTPQKIGLKVSLPPSCGDLCSNEADGTTVNPGASAGILK